MDRVCGRRKAEKVVQEQARHRLWNCLHKHGFACEFEEKADRTVVVARSCAVSFSLLVQLDVRPRPAIIQASGTGTGAMVFLVWLQAGWAGSGAAATCRGAVVTRMEQGMDDDEEIDNQLQECSGLGHKREAQPGEGPPICVFVLSEHVVSLSCCTKACPWSCVSGPGLLPGGRPQYQLRFQRDGFRRFFVFDEVQDHVHCGLSNFEEG